MFNKEKVLPSQYGYPIGGPNSDFKHFYIELHIENPDYEDPNFQHCKKLSFSSNIITILNKFDFVLSWVKCGAKNACHKRIQRYRIRSTYGK